MFNKSIPLLFFVLIIAFIAGFYVSGWSEPSAGYPEDNVPAPLNTGATGQTKSGGLILNTGGASNGLIVDQGNVGIGTLSPTEKLDVDGNVKGTGLCIGNDCIEAWPSGGGGEIPSGAVMFFNLAACPTGWSEVAGARGRYVVGLQPGGTLGGTVGSALSNLQNRATGSHTHRYTDSYWDISYNPDYCEEAGSPYGGIRVGNNRTRTLQTEEPYGGSTSGTNAPYIQFLVCQKN